jgi:ubiquinone/menaquinone biosynthesis C-methylase UbiE
VSDPYSAKFASHVESATQKRIRREVYGEDFPLEADPRSFVTLPELRAMAQDLRVGPGEELVDLGCGQGGPGLWVARETGARVLGIDLSSSGVALALERAKALGIADRANFEVADLMSTGLASERFDAAMSVDVLWAVLDKLSALREVARILRPRARFAFTSWDRDLSPPGYPPPVSNHRPVLEQAGFELEIYRVQPDAEIRRRAYYEALVAAESDLVREMGAEGATKLMFEAKGTLGLVDGVDYLAHSKRIYVVCHRVEGSPGPPDTHH